MSTDPERRLRAALEASAELITDPPDSADYQPATNPDGGDRPKVRSRRQGPWVAPLLAAAAAGLIPTGVTAIARTVNKHEATPVSHRPPPPVHSSPPATPSPPP